MTAPNATMTVYNRMSAMHSYLCGLIWIIFANNLSTSYCSSLAFDIFHHQLQKLLSNKNCCFDDLESFICNFAICCWSWASQGLKCAGLCSLPKSTGVNFNCSCNCFGGNHNLEWISNRFSCLTLSQQANCQLPNAYGKTELWFKARKRL